LVAVSNSGRLLPASSNVSSKREDFRQEYNKPRNSNMYNVCFIECI
jgi:hypothetical protein